MDRQETTVSKSPETHGRRRSATTPSRRSAAGAGPRVGRLEAFPPITAATTLQRSDLRQLLATSDDHRLSIYMPLHAPGADGPKNPIRLKNLLRDAQSHL